MGAQLLQGPFDIPDIPDYVPRRLKPWIFILFVLIIQFSGGIYLAAASDMVGTTALMREDILMAGYASLIGMSLNFAVMFRIKFRFSNRTQLMAACIVLLAANFISYQTDNVPLLVGTCFVAGWFRMQATFACNSTVQLWLTPVRDMAIFFCYVYLVVDGAIQLSGIATVYTAFASSWENMQFIMGGLLALMLILVMILVRPVHVPLHIPLLGIDWLGALLWGACMLSFTFICVYGDFYDWWDSPMICGATSLCVATLALNLWRASFLRHPYVSFMAMKNRNVAYAALIYLVFFTLMGTEHVFEETYAVEILGFDATNAADLNWFVFTGILAGAGFTYLTFALRKWSYKTMTFIGFTFAAFYLAYFYFTIDYNVEKEMLFIPLFCRGFASVLISIVFLTSIVQSGLPFMVFPQALTLNGFAGAVAGATVGPAIIGEMLRNIMADNFSKLSSALTDFNPHLVMNTPGALGELMEKVSMQAMLVSMKQIYGYLLIVALICLVLILLSYSKLRPYAIFPKWSTVRRAIRHTVRPLLRIRDKAALR